MGDHVNLASRLEGQTKDYHVRIIVGESTYMQAKDHYVFRDLDRIRVKGKLKPVNIYELMAFASDSAQYTDLLKMWDSAVATYRAGMFSGALAQFEAILRKYPNDGPSQTFVGRCHEKITAGAAEEAWDGVYVATSK